MCTFKVHVKQLMIVLSLIFFQVNNTCAADTFEEQVYEEFKNSLNSEELYDATLNTFHFQSESKRQLLKKHLKLLFGNEVLVNNFWFELKALLGKPITNSHDDISLLVRNSTLVAMAYIENLSTKGMLRLSAEERREYFIQTYEVTNFMDDKTCAAFQFGSEFIDPLTIKDVIAQYYNSLSDSELRHKLAVVRKAVFAEINNYPLPRIITSNDIYLANEAMIRAMDNWATKTSKEQLQTFALVITNPSAYSYHDQCKAAKTFLEIIIDMEGTFADINRIQILQGIIR